MNNIFLKEIKGDMFTNDPDDSMVARKFYLEFWGAFLTKGSIELVYRGDTLLSFKTIAGCMIRLLGEYNGENMPESSKERLKMINDSKDKLIDKDLKEKFKEFYKKYHTLANFMPLVKLNTCCRSENSSYLQYVKRCSCKEFPDQFFGAIRKYYYKEESNEKFDYQENKAYFEMFGSREEGWKSFVEKNYLQDYFKNDDYSEFISLVPNPKCKMPYRKNIHLNDNDKIKCRNEIKKFLTNANEIIKKRGERLNNIKKKK